MFSIRLALESNGQVLPLNINRIENGVVYCHLADAGVPFPEAIERSAPLAAVGGQPEDTQALSPGAEEGEEAEQPAATGAPLQADLEPSPPEIGQSIMASETAPKKRVKAKAKVTQRPRR
jgi:hypothetical protein